MTSTNALLAHAIAMLEATSTSPSASCKICCGCAHVFDVVDFNKSCAGNLYPFGLSGIPVIYRMCSRCRFIFTDFGDQFTSEQWQQYVYNDEYARADPDYLLVRPRHNAREIITLLRNRKRATIGLDYGGGNGRTAGLLRENGWDFDAFDPFGYTDMSPERDGSYNFCSAFEVFEHTPEPIQTLQSIVKLASPGPLMILIGTSVHDGIVSDQNRLAWWYAAPRNGHISLYSRKSLQILAQKFGLTYACILSGPHVLTRGMSEGEARALLLQGKLLRHLCTRLKLWRGNLH